MKCKLLTVRLSINLPLLLSLTLCLVFFRRDSSTFCLKSSSRTVCLFIWLIIQAINMNLGHTLTFTLFDWCFCLTKVHAIVLFSGNLVLCDTVIDPVDSLCLAWLSFWYIGLVCENLWSEKKITDLSSGQTRLFLLWNVNTSAWLIFCKQSAFQECS